MQLKELIPLFDKAIQEKNEIELYNTGYKVAFIYCKILEQKKHLGFDYEDWASELVLRCMEVARETEYKKESRYYWGILKTGAKYKYLQFLKNEKVLSLDYLSTNEYGETFLDRMDIQNVNPERTGVEDLRTDLVNEIRELADTYKKRNEVWEILKLKYPTMEKSYFLSLSREFGIQFWNNSLRVYLDYMRVYNIYKELNEDAKATRKYVVENKIKHSMNIQTDVNLAKDFIDMFHNHKNTFMARFILPPNATTNNEKYFY